MPGFLGGLDIAVLPSRSEGMSNALLEYMAAGRPVVATAVGAAPELIEDGVHGLLVPPGDAARLAEAINRLLWQPRLARRLGDAARRRARDRYGREAMVACFTDFYEGLRAQASFGGRAVHAGAFDVLTDIPGKPGRFWGDQTTFVGPERPPTWLTKRIGHGPAYNLVGCVAALRLFARRGRCRGVVTQGGASGMLFAWLQALCPWGRKPHVMIDCNWYLSGGRLRDWLKGLQLRAAARSVDRIVVWAEP